MGQVTYDITLPKWAARLVLASALLVLPAGLSGCGPTSGSSAASFSGEAVTPEDELLGAYTEGKPVDGTSAAPTVSAQVLLRTISVMDMDKLYEFLRKVSNNSAVSVGGQRIGNINDLLKKYREHFNKIRLHFQRVSDFWVYMHFNPTSVDPVGFKSSLREMANFVVGVGQPALTNRPPVAGAKKVTKEETRDKGRKCVEATPILLNGCTNMKNQAACNDLTAAMVCVVHYMFKSKQPSTEPQEEGFKPASSDKSDSSGGGGEE